MFTKLDDALNYQEYQSCIGACNRCAESCEFCATSCLREQDVKMLERCIQLNRECASIMLYHFTDYVNGRRTCKTDL